MVLWVPEFFFFLSLIKIFPQPPPNGGLTVIAGGVGDPTRNLEKGESPSLKVCWSGRGSFGAPLRGGTQPIQTDAAEFCRSQRQSKSPPPTLLHTQTRLGQVLGGMNCCPAPLAWTSGTLGRFSPPPRGGVRGRIVDSGQPPLNPKAACFPRPHPSANPLERDSILGLQAQWNLSLAGSPKTVERQGRLQPGSECPPLKQGAWAPAAATWQERLGGGAVARSHAVGTRDRYQGARWQVSFGHQEPVTSAQAGSETG